MAKLYPGIPFSPQTTLSDNIGEADTIIKVADVSVFPDAPNLATIGTDEDGETILYAAKAEGILSGCQRGVEGTAKAWRFGEIIGRNFTAKDHNDLIDTVERAQSTADAAQSSADTAQQTADKAVSDAAKAQASADGCLPLSGGTMSGPIRLSGPIFPIVVISDDANGFAFVKSEDGTISFNSTADPYFGVAENNRVGIGGIATPVRDDNAANKLYVDSRRPNTNLLDNWYFADPINQRGQVEYTGNGYTIDRWRIFTDGTGKVSLHDGYIEIDSVSGTYFDIRQLFENFESNKQYTLSVLTTEGLYTGTSSFDNAAIVAVPITNGLMYLTKEGDNWQVLIRVSIGNKGKLIAAKLEIGNTQTLAHKEGDTWVLNDPPPNKALELLKCQMYQQVFRGYSFLGFGVIDTNHFCQYSFPIATPMRTPSVSVTVDGAVRFFDGNAVYLSNESEDFASCNIGVAKTGARFPDAPIDRPGIVYLDNDNCLILDANL